MSPLLVPALAWLWAAVAGAADRRGDPEMLAGPAITVRLPVDAHQRAAAVGLVRGSPKPGQRVRLDLGELARMVQTRSTALTPGAVAAHATGRVLAERAARLGARHARRQMIRDALAAACARISELAEREDDLYAHLRRTGWIARLDADEGNGPAVVARAVAVVGTVLGLPDGERFDRRLLVPEDPHALDDGTPLAGTTLSLLAAVGRITADQRTTSRSLWAQAGVDCDDVMGGLTVLGVAPRDWTLPAAATCTLPPRELARARWPPATGDDSWVFVTENPSVLAASADMVARTSGLDHVRLVCTMGTPSAIEVAAIGRLAEAGWRIAVRADFDPPGIRHVTALLAGIPDAVPWRMTAADYLMSRPTTPTTEPIPPTPWDDELQAIMASTGNLAFEEAVMPALLDDLRHGAPG